MAGLDKTQRDVRSLSKLAETASTSRVLNLGQVYRFSSDDPDYLRRPFFVNKQMNRAIILKHTVRQNELGLFQRPRRTATKVILPFDSNDLRLGGQSILIGQYGYESFLRHLYNAKDISALVDVDVLKALDDLPSLDPFLIKEQLARRGHRPAPCYLKISAADVSRMISFANSEIERLVRTAFGSSIQSAALKLTGKILSDELDSDLEPLRQVLRLSPDEFSDGIFSWRGFLYFKWRLMDLQDNLNEVLEGLGAYKPISTRDRSVTDLITTLRPRLAARIASAIDGSTATLAIYDRAYKGLVNDQNPGLFQKFLVEGPQLFFQLGESLGILSHISSFWNYRMKNPRGMVRMAAEDYADLLIDYDESLSILNLDG